MLLFAYKSLVLSLILTLLVNVSHAETFTFHTVGDYSDTSNWDTYPGNYVENGDTLLIEADFNVDVNLDVYDGVVILNSDVVGFEVSYVNFWYDSKLVIESNYLTLNIYGHLEIADMEVTSNFFSLIIANFGYGILSYGNPFIFNDDIQYDNYGTQNNSFFDGYEGYFFNAGTILVEFDDLILNCQLELFDGTIEGYSSFDIIQQSGSIQQSCSSCTSSTINCQSVTIKDAETEGTWNID